MPPAWVAHTLSCRYFLSIYSTFQYVTTSSEIANAVATVSTLLGNAAPSDRIVGLRGVLPVIDMGDDGRLVFVTNDEEATALAIEEAGLPR